jgi:hypothetical protein
MDLILFNNQITNIIQKNINKPKYVGVIHNRKFK